MLFRSGFSGDTFSAQAYEQASRLGVYLLLGHEVVGLHPGHGAFGIDYREAGWLFARAVLITVGVTPRPLPFDVEHGCGCNVTNELSLQPAAPGEHVLVYGGGNSAGQAACYYAKMGCSVSILSRRPLEETMDARWVTSLQGLGVTMHAGEIQEVNDTVIFCSSGEVQHLTPGTLHSFLGGEPATSWLQGLVGMDEQGYILADTFHCTFTPGIFAAGDCVSGSVKRFTCAIGGGGEAVSAISRYLDASMTR